jgi:hypothetical protein
MRACFFARLFLHAKGWGVMGREEGVKEEEGSSHDAP